MESNQADTVIQANPTKLSIEDIGLDFFIGLVQDVIENIVKTDSEWLLSRLTE